MRPNQIPRGLLSTIFNSASMPRGFVPVAAGADRQPREMLAELTQSVEEFKTEHRSQLRAAQTAFDDVNKRLAAIGVGGGSAGGDIATPDDPEYTQVFASYARGAGGGQRLTEANQTGDRARINAAMSVSPGEAGGYLAPVEWDRLIRKAQRELSPFRQIANVISTSVRGYSTVWNAGGWGSGWVGEVASRPQTSTPTLATLTFDHGEIYANPAISQQLIDDADFGLEQWLATEVADEFDRQEGVAFIAGDGTNKPRGLLTYVPGGVSETQHPGGTLGIEPSGAASALTADGLVSFVYSLPVSYRQNARWLMASSTAAAVAKMKDGQGNYLWRDAFIAGQPATLLGFPVSIDENMPAVSAGNLAIAFGDFRRGYVINDRFGVRVLRDPFTAKPFVSFYTTKRVGGGVADPRAIRLLRIAAA